MARLDAIGIVARDVAASCAFYRLLGVDVHDPTGADDHVEATLPGGLRLMWDSEELIRELQPGWVRPECQAVGLAFLCDGPAEVDATYARLVEAGYRSASEPWDAFWGQRYAQVYDPDGNRVDLFAPLH